MRSPVSYWHSVRILVQLVKFLITKHLVLHPYYKLAYIKLSWGGEEEQAAEIAAGNPEVKNWQDEAKKIVEKTVSRVVHLGQYYGTKYMFKRWLNITDAVHWRSLSHPLRTPYPLRRLSTPSPNMTSTVKPYFTMI